MLFRLTTASDNQRTPRYAEAAFDALHESNPRRQPLALEMAAVDGRVSLFFRAGKQLATALAEELRDVYPGCRIEPVSDGHLDAPQGYRCWVRRLRLVPDFEAINTYPAFEERITRSPADPLAALLSVLRTGRAGRLRTRVVIRLKPARPARYRQTARAAEPASRPFLHPLCADAHRRWCTSRLCHRRWLSRLVAMLASREAGKPFQSPEKLARHLFETHLTVSVAAPGAAARRAREKHIEIAGALGRFTSRQARFVSGRARPRELDKPRGRGFLLAADELATLWHPPVSNVRIARLHKVAFREFEPPIQLPSKEREAGVTVLGRVRFRNERDCFGIRADDLRKHLFVCGRTGTGKSTLIRTMALDSIEAGRSVWLIDPHGDLVDAVLAGIPRRRTNEVVLFDAADRDCPVAFNPLQCDQPRLKPLVADGVLASLKRIYGDSWGPRLEQILRNGLLTMLEAQDATLFDLSRLLTDGSFRQAMTARVEDPIVRSFWRDVFDRWNERFRTEAVSPVLNKLDGFLSNPIARAITCQARGTIRLRRILDDPRSIFLCNLSKGRIGEHTSSLLGSLLVAALQTAALGRADAAENERPDVQVYIDEFHNFVSESNTSFATMLSESRKYRVAFAALATQFLDQIDRQTLSAVLGNCGSTVCFRCGVRDAEVLAEHLGGDTTPQDLLQLPNYTAYARLLVGGEPTPGPFSMVTLPPVPRRPSHQDPAVIRRTSRHRYGRAAEQVEVALHPTANRG